MKNIKKKQEHKNINKKKPKFCVLPHILYNFIIKIKLYNIKKIFQIQILIQIKLNISWM